jgi:hypothetical protein
VVELARSRRRTSRRRRGGLSDADQLARLTGVPGGVWVFLLICVGTTASPGDARCAHLDMWPSQPDRKWDLTTVLELPQSGMTGLAEDGSFGEGLADPREACTPDQINQYLSSALLCDIAEQYCLVDAAFLKLTEMYAFVLGVGLAVGVIDAAEQQRHVWINIR